MNNQTQTDSSHNLMLLGISFFTIGLILHGRLTDFKPIANLPGYINNLFMASGFFLILYSILQLYLSKKGLDIDPVDYSWNSYIKLVFTTLFQTSMLLIFFAFIFMIFWLIFRNFGLFNSSFMIGSFDINFYLIILLTLVITFLQNYIYTFSKK